MSFSDIFIIAKWWFMFFTIGLAFLPLASLILSNFFDKGYIFAKILGIALISYSVFILGSLKILPFTEITIALTGLVFLSFNYILISKPPNLLISLKKSWKIFFFEEILFLGILLFWSYIHGFQPDIHGLEKYMDFGFINSILRADFFPPKDMWFAPFPINYYYFGHLITAVLTKISFLSSAITFNLMLSTIAALSFASAFSIGANLIKNFKFQISNLKLIAGGLITAFILNFAGNLHTIYLFFKPYANENPVPFWQLLFSPQTFPNNYWYPNATRFIENTIHEFPIYSSVVSDLHGHVLDIPFVLLTIALLMSIFFRFNDHSQIQNSKIKVQNCNSKFKTFGPKLFTFNLPVLSLSNGSLLTLLAFLLAIMYMTNAWDGIIYFILSIFIIGYSALKSIINPSEIKNVKLKVQSCGSKFKNFIILFFPKILLLGVLFFLFALPFSINFKPFASGIGILCAPKFLTDIGSFGPFLFEADHCQRSPFWQLIILYGFFYFWVISFFIFLLKNSKHEARNSKQSLNSNVQNLKRFGNLNFGHLNLFRISDFGFRILPSDIFVGILIILSTLLIIIPEFIYIKDIYPAHYRANTMFKLAYQAFIMLSLSSGYIIMRILNIKYEILKIQIKNKIFNFYYVYLLFTILFLILVFLYPYFAINSYFGNLKTYSGLNGTNYLRSLYPNDYGAILWINGNIKGQPVVLEVQGDSYTDYARVSTNTGLPTVLGWTVHEWLWRGTYDIPAPRIPEIEKMYESDSLEETKILLKKYNVSFVFIGDLERQKYSKLNEKKLQSLGKTIYQEGNTKIIEVNTDNLLY